MNNYRTTIRYSDDALCVKFHKETILEVSDYLEQIFAEWNHGSRQECDAFLLAQNRSLSVGDYVQVNGLWYRCEGIGWKMKTDDEVDTWFNTLAEFRNARPVAKTIGDERYLRWMDKRKTEEKLQLFV